MRVALLLAGACGALAYAGGRADELLAFNRQGILGGEVWRLWTGHLVHYSTGHAALDIVALLVLAGLAEREAGVRAVAALLAVAMPLISLCLLLAAPDMLLYKGASALATLFGVACGALLWRREPRLRAGLALLGCMALAKTVCDAAGLLPGLSSLPDGVLVAWQAHVVGGCIALAWALGFWPGTRSPTAAP